jgi:hypothetical protein
VRSAEAEELLVHEVVEHVEAGGLIDIPQTAGLCHGEPQARHFHVLAMNAVQESEVAVCAKPFRHGSVPFSVVNVGGM